MVVDLQLPMPSVVIAIKIVSSHPLNARCTKFQSILESEISTTYNFHDEAMYDSSHPRIMSIRVQTLYKTTIIV